MRAGLVGAGACAGDVRRDTSRIVGQVLQGTVEPFWCRCTRSGLTEDLIKSCSSFLYMTAVRTAIVDFFFVLTPASAARCSVSRNRAREPTALSSNPSGAALPPRDVVGSR